MWRWRACVGHGDGFERTECRRRERGFGGGGGRGCAKDLGDLLEQVFELSLLCGFWSRFGGTLLEAVKDGEELERGRVGSGCGRDCGWRRGGLRRLLGGRGGGWSEGGMQGQAGCGAELLGCRLWREVALGLCVCRGWRVAMQGACEGPARVSVDGTVCGCGIVGLGVERQVLVAMGMARREAVCGRSGLDVGCARRGWRSRV